MEDQELWDLMGDLEDVGLGDSLTKAYSIKGFYFDEGIERNDGLVEAAIRQFADVNSGDGLEVFIDNLLAPDPPAIDPLISHPFGNRHLLIIGDLTKVRSLEKKLRDDFEIESEYELKDYKKFVLFGSSGYVGGYRNVWDVRNVSKY